MPSSARLARLMTASALCVAIAASLTGCASGNGGDAGGSTPSASSQTTAASSPSASTSPAADEAAELLARAAERNAPLAQATAVPVQATGTWTAEVDEAEAHERQTRAYSFSELASPAVFERRERVALNDQSTERTFLAEADSDPAHAGAFLIYTREGEGAWAAGTASAGDFPGQAIGDYAALRVGSLLSIAAKQPENVRTETSKSTITLSARPKDEVKDELIQAAFGTAISQWGDSFEADTATLMVTLDAQTLRVVSLSLDAAGSAVRGEESREIAFREECSYDHEPAADAVAIPDEARAAAQQAAPAEQQNAPAGQ